MAVSDVCATMPDGISLTRYVNVFEDNQCPQQYTLFAYRTDMGVDYNGNNVRRLQPYIRTLLTSVYNNTNQFGDDDSMLVDRLVFMCNGVPGLCDATLYNLCQDAREGGTSTRLCGCFKPDEPTLPTQRVKFVDGTSGTVPAPCDASCDTVTTVKYQRQDESSELARCNAPICAVSAVSVRQLGNSDGNVRISSVCGQCSAENQCQCIFDPTNARDSQERNQVTNLYRDATRSSVCSTVNCEGDCTKVIGGGQSASILWIVLIAFFVVLVVGWLVTTLA